MTDENKINDVEVTEEAHKELTEKEKEILGHINEKIELFTTEMIKDLEGKGYELKLKINVAFAPLGEMD